MLLIVAMFKFVIILQIIPDHVVPSIFFYPFIPGRAPLAGKQSSIVTM